MKSRFGEILYRHGFANGTARYDDLFPGQQGNNRLVVWAKLSGLVELPLILDTGAPRSIIDPALLHGIGVVEIGLKRTMIVRAGEYEGRLVRIPLTSMAEEGEDRDLEVSAFVPDLYETERWPHPNFLGLNNAMDKLRIALDPAENAFHFGLIG